jgi:hypothetical protein
VCSWGYRSAEVLPELLDTPDHTYRLKSFSYRERGRRAMRISLGPHLHGAALPVPDISHTPSQIEGTIKRIACRMPQPDRAKLRRLKRFVDKFLNLHFSGDQFTEEENFEFDEFIENTPYTRARKNDLTATHSKPFDPVKGYNVKGFTKNENYPEYKHFRGIMSRSDDYKTRVGPFFRKFDKILFSKKFFIKKVPVYNRASWLSDKFRFAREIYCTDFSSFEATFGIPLLKVELFVYDWFLRYNKHRVRIMEMIRSGIGSLNRIVYKYFSFCILGRRMSGEMNTSGGNGLMNLMMTYFILHERGNPLDLESAFEGDDGEVEINHISQQPTAEDYTDLGAKIKIDKPDSPSEASFCGLIYDVNAMDNVTSPMEILMSFGWTTDQYVNASQNKLLALLRSKSLSLLYEYPACPIVKELALYGLRMTANITDKYLRKVFSKMRINEYDKRIYDEAFDALRHGALMSKPIQPATRALVAKRYDIPVHVQLSVEKYINGLNVLQPLVIPEIMPLIHLDCKHYFSNYVVQTDKPTHFTYVNFPKRKYKLWQHDDSNHPNVRLRGRNGPHYIQY